MTMATLILALAVTMAGVCYLMVTNAKRRRTLGQQAYQASRYLWLARLAIWGPGLALALAGQGAAFVLWLGSLMVLGWVVVAAPPGTKRLAHDALNGAWGRIDGAFVVLRDHATAALAAVRSTWDRIRHAAPTISRNSDLMARIGGLEARIAVLEAELRAARSQPQDQEAIEPDLAGMPDTVTDLTPPRAEKAAIVSNVA